MRNFIFFLKAKDLSLKGGRNENYGHKNFAKYIRTYTNIAFQIIIALSFHEQKKFLSFVD